MSGRQREIIAESSTPDGEALTLTLEGDEYVVRVRREVLMSSRQSGSEQAMATLAFDKASFPAACDVLIGGLGMGFTVRAVLDHVPQDAKVQVVELLQEVVTWNHGVLASFAARPLDDPRVTVTIADLLDELVTYRDEKRHFDAILLDIDNGPEAFTITANDRLYDARGLHLLHGILREGGVMVLWSAFRSLPFERRLRKAGFDARSVTTRARADVGKGARHTLFVAVKARA